MVSDRSASGDSADDASWPASIPFGPAAGTWSIGWVIGTIVVAPLLVSALGAELGDGLTIPQLFVVALAAWAAFLVVLMAASRKFGTGQFVSDYSARFRPVDLIGVPVGVVTQLLLLPLLYWPLRSMWPDTFSSDKIEQRAQDLADRATGMSALLLVAIVVIGAPIVEELVYRGLLQRSMALITAPVPALVFTAIWFALIHFSPVEYPGLFLAGLVFGVGVVLTNRIGPAIVTHAAFNATGIAMVLSNR